MMVTLFGLELGIRDGRDRRRAGARGEREPEPDGDRDKGGVCGAFLSATGGGVGGWIAIGDSVTVGSATVGTIVLVVEAWWTVDSDWARRRLRTPLSIRSASPAIPAAAERSSEASIASATSVSAAAVRPMEAAVNPV